MIIVTNRAPELIGWIDRNLADSNYTFCKSWHADCRPDGSLKDGWIANRPYTIEISFDATDRVIFDLYWTGQFIENPVNGKLYDDTEINRRMIGLFA